MDFIKGKGTSIDEIRTKIKLGHGTLNKAFKKNDGINIDYVANILSLWPETTEKEKYFIYTGEILEEGPEASTNMVREPNGYTNPIESMAQWMSKVDREIASLKEKVKSLENNSTINRTKNGLEKQLD